MWAPTSDSLTAATLAASFLAAATGSLHCLGMCGPLRLLSGNGIWMRLQYQGGRLLAYLALGAAAGWIGKSIPPMLWIPVLAIALLFSLAKSPRLTQWKAARARIISVASTKPAFLGLASGLLPCGMLHAWILVSGATANAFHGAAVLGILWLGTLPMLEIGSLAFRRPLLFFRNQFPRAFPLFFLALALLPILYRNGIFSHSSHEHSSPKSASHCHESP